jgi:hypothetical protein
LTFDISSSSDSIVADFEPTCAFKSSMDALWLGDAVEARFVDFLLWV